VEGAAQHMHQEQDPHRRQSEVEALEATVQALRDDLRLAIDAAHAAEAAKGAEAGRRVRLENELAAAEERLREMVDILAHLDQRTADAVRAHQEFHDSRSYRFLHTVLAPYRRVRRR
jgi:L-alanine-DL-glutamate epimerase-like enolase superfamily enzyme